MATFHIHQDPHGKENVVNNPGKQQHNKNQDLKGKRPTLAVLSNVDHHMVRGQQGKSMAFSKQTQHNKIANIEKQMFTSTNFQQQQKKKIIQSTVTTAEQIAKTFVVFEDDQITRTTTAAAATKITNVKATAVAAATNDKLSSVVAIGRQVPTSKIIEHSMSSDANTSASAIRDPLKEITSSGVCVETPMSESEIVSPMSVDKTASATKLDSENLPPSSIERSKKNSGRLFEVDEYQRDILDYYKEVEKKHRPKPTYMKRQPDINNSMRTILVDWLVEVTEEYRLHTETLYLAVSYIDRFLSYMSVVRAKLQLVGTAAMFIASKYEEIYPPDVGEFVFITDDTYTKAQVLRMEQIILKILSFDLNVPSPPVFLNMFAVLHDIPDQVKLLATYLSELTLLENEPFLQYLPSQISSAALALSRYILEFPMWCVELQTITSYSLDDLKDIILHISRLHKEALKLPQQAIQEKYKSSKYMQVSSIKPVELDEDQLNYLVKQTNKVIAATQINDSLSSK